MKRYLPSRALLPLLLAATLSFGSGCSLFRRDPYGNYEYKVQLGPELTVRETTPRVDVFIIGSSKDSASDPLKTAAVNTLLENPKERILDPFNADSIRFDATSKSPRTISPSAEMYKKWVKAGRTNLIFICDYPRDTQTPQDDRRRAFVSLVKNKEWGKARQIVITIQNTGLKVEPAPRD